MARKRRSSSRRSARDRNPRSSGRSRWKARLSNTLSELEIARLRRRARSSLLAQRTGLFSIMPKVELVPYLLRRERRITPPTRREYPTVRVVRNWATEDAPALSFLAPMAGPQRRRRKPLASVKKCTVRCKAHTRRRNGPWRGKTGAAFAVRLKNQICHERCK